MPHKKNNNSDGVAEVIKLSDGETKMIDAVFKLTGPSGRPNPDWDVVANTCGLSNAKCSRERFRQICKKYGWFENTGEATPSTPASNAKKRAAANDTQDADTLSPGLAKRLRKTPKKKYSESTSSISTSADEEVVIDQIRIDTLETGDDNVKIETLETGSGGFDDYKV